MKFDDCLLEEFRAFEAETGLIHPCFAIDGESDDAYRRRVQMFYSWKDTQMQMINYDALPGASEDPV